MQYKIKTISLYLSFLILGGALISCGKTPTGPASKVKNNATLKVFVESAKDLVQKDYDKALAEFKSDEWKQGSVYVFILKATGTTVFHAGNPSLEGKDLSSIKDANGVFFVKEIIAAAKRGGGYINYEFDNPATKKVKAVPKVSYALPFTKEGVGFIIGSGYYK